MPCVSSYTRLLDFRGQPEYASCTITGTPWVYGYGQYNKPAKDIPLVQQQAVSTGTSLTLAGYLFSKVSSYLTGSAKDLAYKAIVRNRVVPTYYIYVEHKPAFGSAPFNGKFRVVIEWWADRAKRDQVYNAMVNAFTRYPTDQKRVSYLAQAYAQAPKASTLEDVVYAIAQGFKNKVIADAKKTITDEIDGVLKVSAPPTYTETSLGVWPYVIGAAIFGSVLLLFLHRK